MRIAVLLVVFIIVRENDLVVAVFLGSTLGALDPGLQVLLEHLFTEGLVVVVVDVDVVGGGDDGCVVERAAENFVVETKEREKITTRFPSLFSSSKILKI